MKGYNYVGLFIMEQNRSCHKAVSRHAAYINRQSITDIL